MNFTVEHVQKINSEWITSHREQLCDAPFGSLSLQWSDILQQSQIPGLEVSYLPVTLGEELAAVGIVYVVRKLSIPQYLPLSLALPFQWLKKLGLRPLCLDVAYLEVPGANRPGLLILKDFKKFQFEIQELILHAFRKKLSAHIYCVKTIPDHDSKRLYEINNLLRLPFLPNPELDFTCNSFDSWFKSQRKNLRHSIKRNTRIFKEAGGTISIEKDLAPQIDNMYQLYEALVAHHKDRGNLATPFMLNKQFFNCIAALPESDRSIIVARIKGKPAAFALLLHDKVTVHMKTAGINHIISRPTSAYLNLYYYTIRFTVESGFTRMDFGPTTYELKNRFGVQLNPTEYWVDFATLALRPLGWLVRVKFKSQGEMS